MERVGPGGVPLSDDLLALVFGHLAEPCDRRAAALACKGWLRIVTSHAIRSLQLLRPSILSNIPNRFRSLTALDLSQARAVREPSVVHIADAYKATLVSLSLAQNKGIADAALDALGNCTKLTSLDVSNCHHDSSPITDKGIASLANCTSLTTLRLAGARAITDAGLEALLPSLNNLLELSLRWCTGLTDAALVTVQRQLSHLQRLDLAYCSFTDEGMRPIARLPALTTLLLACCSAIGDSGLCRLGCGCKALQTLDLSGCMGISEQGIGCLVGRCPQLRELTVAHNQQLLPGALVIYHHLQALQVLNLSACAVSEDGLRLLGAGCHELTSLSLRRCSDVTDAGIAAIALGCRDLRDLDLTCCRHVSDAGLHTVADFCSRLAVLRLEGCQAVTHVALQSLAQRCPALAHLDLTDCALNDAALTAVAVCRNLQVLRLGYNAVTSAGLLTLAAAAAARGGLVLIELDLYRCADVEDAALTALLPHCRRLRKANLSYCSRLSNATLLALAQCPKMINLEMRGWGSVTAAGLGAFGRGCARLTELDIKHVALPEDAMAAVAANFPVLRQLHMSCCPVSDAAIEPLARCHTLQTIKMVQCSFLGSRCLTPFVTGCESIRKIKLDGALRACVIPDHVAALEARLCHLKWMDKG